MRFGVGIEALLDILIVLADDAIDDWVAGEDVVFVVPYQISGKTWIEVPYLGRVPVDFGSRKGSGSWINSPRDSDLQQFRDGIRYGFPAGGDVDPRLPVEMFPRTQQASQFSHGIGSPAHRTLVSLLQDALHVFPGVARSQTVAHWERRSSRESEWKQSLLLWPDTGCFVPKNTSEGFSFQPAIILLAMKGEDLA